MTAKPNDAGRVVRRPKMKVFADYTRECAVCGATPVVSLTGLCGPCTFGEAACADPAEWEGEYEGRAK